MRNGQLKAGYNVQLAVNSEYITGMEVFSNRTDVGTLRPFLRKLELAHKQRYEEVTADAGYESLENYLYLEANGQVSFIPLVRVHAISMEENTMGGYDHASRTVMLSLEHLAFDPSEELLNTICHEVRHAYQHYLVELYQSLKEQEQNLALFHEISDYAYEFDNYISGFGETIEAYFEQKCEVDSSACV